MTHQIVCGKCKRTRPAYDDDLLFAKQFGNMLLDDNTICTDPTYIEYRNKSQIYEKVNNDILYDCPSMISTMYTNISRLNNEETSAFLHSSELETKLARLKTHHTAQMAKLQYTIEHIVLLEQTLNTLQSN